MSKELNNMEIEILINSKIKQLNDSSTGFSVSRTIRRQDRDKLGKELRKKK